LVTSARPSRLSTDKFGDKFKPRSKNAGEFHKLMLRERNYQGRCVDLPSADGGGKNFCASHNAAYL
jgi:hypothetical protein